MAQYFFDDDDASNMTYEMMKPCRSVPPAMTATSSHTTCSHYFFFQKFQYAFYTPDLTVMSVVTNDGILSALCRADIPRLGADHGE